MKKNDPNLIHHVHLISEQTNQIFYDKLNYIYLQLPNLPKKWENLNSQLERWLYLIKYLDKKEDIVVEKDDHYQRWLTGAMSLAEYRKMSAIERLEYEKMMRWEHDRELCRQYALE